MSLNYLFFLGNLKGRGGTENACITTCNRLSEEKNVIVYLVVYNSKSDCAAYKISENVRLIYLECPNWKLLYPVIVFKLFYNILRLKIDFFVTVEMYNLLFTIPVFWIKKLFFNRLKFVVWEHYNFNVTLNRKFRSYARRWSFRNADSIVLLTKSDLDVWVKNLGFSSKLTVIPNGLIINVDGRAYDSKSKTILAIGRFDKIKRFDLLIDIWYGCFKKYKNELEGWKVNLVGDGILKKEYVDKINILKLHDTFIIREFTSNIQEIYEKGAILCMSSEYEGFGLVLIEAQSFGIPQIAFDCPVGPREVIKNGRTGYLINDGEIEKYIDCLHSLICNEEERKRLSDESFINSIEYDINKVVLKWLAL